METKRDCPCELEGFIDELRIKPIGVRLWTCDECEAAWRSSDAVDSDLAAGLLDDVVKALAPGARRDDIEVIG